MKLRVQAAGFAALLLLLAVTPAQTQNYRSALGVYGGGAWFSDLNDDGDFEDIVDGTLFRSEELSLESGWITGAQFETWLGAGRFGVRLNAGFTERSFELDRVFAIIDDDVVETDGDGTFGDVNTWLGDVDLMLRLLRPERDRAFAPYLTAGFGVVHYDPAGEGTVIPLANAQIDDRETELAAAFGIGGDFMPGALLPGFIPFMLRIELVDHWTFESPMEPIIAVDDEDYDGVHNLRLTAGLHALFGRLFPEEVVAAVPAPPPAPPAPPEPEEEMITVCVVDPLAPGGLREVDAIYLPETRDTVVVRNGDRVAFQTAYPATAPLYAGEARWFVRGEPMTLTVAAREIEFVSFGGTRIIEPAELTWIGNYRGTPVYASAEDVAEVRDELEDALERDEDLEDVLEERMELREALADVEVVYVPTETGCVFQPFRMVEDVRKVRG